MKKTAISKKKEEITVVELEKNPKKTEEITKEGKKERTVLIREN